MSEASTPEAAPGTASASTSALRELLHRYRAVFAAAWQMRHELAGPARLSDETAFLPAALSLQDTPVHPAPRRLAWGIIALFLIAILWACFGKIDIVASAPGHIIVGDRTKTIQPLEAGVVRRILVNDGDRVKAGQVLVELDSTLASADRASFQEQLAAQTSEMQRTAALLDMLEANGATSAIRPELIKGMPASTQQQLRAEWQDIRAKLAKLEAETAHRKAEIVTVRESIAKLEALLPMAAAREADYKNMTADGYVPEHAAQDKTRDRIGMESDLAMWRARLVETESALNEATRASVAYLAETRHTLQDRNMTAELKVQQFKQELAKAAQRERLTQLTSPVEGMVQQLAVHTTGGVVTAAQQLMVVVPDSSRLTAEVTVANLDIGFVAAGQSAEVKLETFPYTRYGTVPARVDMVTADAVTDEKKGSYYPAILTLEKKQMNVDGKLVPLAPGMNITAEIRTGERRVIEYLISPIQKAGSESLRER